MNEKLNNIMNLTLDKLKNSLADGKIRVCVIGIGRIGLPTALSIAKSGLPTIGIDVNSNLVKMINEKNFPLKDEPSYDKIFLDVINNGLFKATTDFDETVANSNMIILSLPTPMNEKNIPDYSIILSVAKQLQNSLTSGSLVVIESTVEPGFIENEFVPIIEGNGLKVGQDMGVGVCPETANPGEIMKDFTNLPRLVAGMDSNTTDILLEVYHHIFPVELIKMPNCKTANAVKLTTNVFRDINIAFVNELALLFEKLGIDTLKVLEAASRKYNFQVHFPSAGVGGPCLPVNSYQMINSANKIDESFLQLVRTSRKINEEMPEHVVELLLECLSSIGKSLESSNILILGVSYKPNVKDVQISPAENVIKILKSRNAKIRIFDPFFINEKVFDFETENNLGNALKISDAVVIITPHDELKTITVEFIVANMKNPIIVDSVGMIDINAAKKAGIIYRCIGRDRTG